MAKRKISLIGLVVVMICVLVFAPVVTAGIYFIHTVSGQLQHTASETVSMYLNEFTDRTDRMMETLRDGKINIYDYINEKQLEKLNPPQDLRSAIEKIGWKNRPITA